jgi:putative colanic acid biosynthesis glycosyltransferase
MSIYPLISIVTVVRNLRHEIAETIESVINQTYPNIEYIVIDGGSDDGTLEVIHNYQKDIYQLVSEPDRGIYDAMNKGIKLASGDFITFLNAGDKYSNLNCLHELALKINENHSVYFGNATIMSDNASWVVPPKACQIDKWLVKYHPCHQAVFYPKLFYKENYYSDEIGSTADADYTIRAYEDCLLQFQYVDTDLVQFQLGGVSNKFSNLQSAYNNLKTHINLRKRHRNRYPKQSDILFFISHFTKFLAYRIGGQNWQYKIMEISKSVYWRKYK